MTNAQTAPIATKTLGNCDRCDGKGWLHGMSHYANGTCFLCRGTGRRAYTPGQVKQTAEMVARIAKHEAECEVQRAFVLAHADQSAEQLVNKLGAIRFERLWSLHRFVASMVTAGDEAARPMLDACKVLLERQIIAA